METMIKAVNQTDSKILQTISRATFSETFGQDNTEEDLAEYLEKAYNQNQLIDEIQKTNSRFYFIYADQKIAGYLKLNIKDAQTEEIVDNALEVERIYVLKQYQGLKLGKQLIKFAMQRAEALNKAGIWLGVWEENEKALHFYQHYGFQKISEHVFQLGQDKQTDFILYKELD